MTKQKKNSFTPDLLTGRLTETDAKRYFSRFGWFAFAMLLLTTLFQMIIDVIVYYCFPAFYGHFLFAEILSFVPLYCLALPLAGLILRPLPTVVPLKAKMGAGKWFCGLCICITLMLGGNYISQIILTFFQTLRGDIMENPVEQVVNSMPLWATFVFVVILAPILEELFFRGIVCKKLLAVGEGYAIVISAALFGLFHGNFFQLFYAFALGCFFAFIYVKTGKLINSILYHMAINFLGGFVAPLILRFIDLDGFLEGDINISQILENIIPLLGLLWYELLMYGMAIAGIVLIIKNLRQFKPQAGLLPPPEKGRVSVVLLNVGVAAAITVFSLTLVSSLLM